jgi:hypothetical protein
MKDNFPTDTKEHGCFNLFVFPCVGGEILAKVLYGLVGMIPGGDT